MCLQASGEIALEILILLGMERRMLSRAILKEDSDNLKYPCAPRLPAKFLTPLMEFPGSIRTHTIMPVWSY